MNSYIPQSNSKVGRREIITRIIGAVS